MGKKEILSLEPLENLPLVDVHCHFLDSPNKRNSPPPKEQINHFFEEGGRFLILSTIDMESYESLSSLVESVGDPRIKLCMGWGAQTVTYTSKKDHTILYNKWKELLLEKKDSIVAIGEIGLDFHHAKTLQQRKEQISILEDIFQSTRDLNLPYVLHVRNAGRNDIDKDHPNHPYNDPDGATRLMVKLIEKHGLKPSRIMWHCYSGPVSWTPKLVEMGFFLSVPSSAYGQRKWRNNTKEAPIDLLLTETDSPFQHPYQRSGFNEPVNVKYSIAAIAYTHNMEQEEVAKKVLDNAIRFFSLE